MYLFPLLLSSSSNHLDTHQFFQQFLQRQCAAANRHKLREFTGEGDTETSWRNWRHKFNLAVEINYWGNAPARATNWHPT